MIFFSDIKELWFFIKIHNLRDFNFWVVKFFLSCSKNAFISIDFIHNSFLSHLRATELWFWWVKEERKILIHNKKTTCWFCTWLSRYTSSGRKKKYTALRALQFCKMAWVFYYFRGKFGLNMLSDLKSKQIEYLKN